jgi:hypothetical protein
MRIYHDPDLYETVVESKPCTRCHGDTNLCDGGCNGSLHIGSRRRPDAEVAKIKADRIRQIEDEILLKAEAIRARRSLSGDGAHEKGG